MEGELKCAGLWLALHCVCLADDDDPDMMMKMMTMAS